jgi:exosortase/archaeosortase family protein
MTFITVGAAIAFLSNRSLWQRILITLSAIPIAVFCNVMRVTGQGLLDHYVSRDLALGFAHQFVGVIMLIPAFLLILLVAWVLDHLFIEEVDEKDKLRARGGAVAKKEDKVITIPRQQPAVATAPAAAAPAAVAPAPVQRPAVTTPPRPGAPRTPPAAKPAGPALLGGAKPQAANPVAPKPQPAQTQQPQQRREQS